MVTYYPHLDHAVPDCSGLSSPWTDCVRHDFTKADKVAFAKFAEMTATKPGINALKQRVDEITALLAKVADGWSDSTTGGYDWW